MSDTRLALHFDGVTLAYTRGAPPVVIDASINAPTGAITAIVGPNGSGKSSLVRGVLGLMPEHRGRILAGTVDLLRAAQNPSVHRSIWPPLLASRVYP